ncbi:fumarylacetoacetate hydrolase family protein [Thalassobacillus sp. CUG 92003]|uniref:fumarylacetoacetate hydrolase family protein n=1 Tax=Thalassobacillus sp. CUG 92003 TaxID=2736641 RepID=UPI0015E75591
MKPVQNIYCVGRNYVKHAKELNNEIPSSPLMFSKPTHALAEANGGEIVLPGDRGSVHYEAEFVIRLRQPYEEGMSVEDVVDSMALGIDFTLRDVQDQLRKKGQPWLLSKGFPNSAVITPFLPFDGEAACQNQDFSLLRNEERVQIGNIRDMIFDLHTLIAYTATHLGAGEGDIIFTGTPEGVGPVAHGDHYTLLCGTNPLGNCTIKLQ